MAKMPLAEPPPRDSRFGSPLQAVARALGAARDRGSDLPNVDQGQPAAAGVVSGAAGGQAGASGRTSRIRRGGLPTRCRFGHGLSTRQRPQPPTRPETVTSIAGERVGASRIGEVSQRPFVTRSNHLSQEAFHRPTCQRLSGEADMRVTRVASMAVAAVVVACVADETTRSQAAAIGSGLIQATLIYNYH